MLDFCAKLDATYFNRSLFAASRAKVHSFDVFDTSLIRKVAVPTDVFRLMGRLIAQNNGAIDEANFIEDFLSARIRAEETAKSNREETNLNQIWEVLRETMPQLPLAATSSKELDVERKLLLPNSIIAKQIARLRSTGARIIFTSDTYLPEEFLREQLLRYGLAEESDAIYASSAAGVTKWAGGLFKLILSREGIAAEELHHYGDNPHSDVSVPRRLGIRTTLVAHSRFNRWERAVLSKDIHSRLAASLLAGSMRAFRLSADVTATSGADQLVTTFLGPLLLVWASWVLGTAQRDGVHRLYFVARDAYLLYRASRVLASCFGDIDCRYLKISRQAILIPSTEEIGPSKMAWLHFSPKPTEIGYYVNKLGLNWKDVERHFLSLCNGQGQSKLLTTEKEWDQFWNVVQNSPVAAVLRAEIENKRANALAYLRAKGLCDESIAATVDIGWQAMVQAGLRKLLKRGEQEPPLRGYYLGLCIRRMAPADAGKVTALFWEHPPDRESIWPPYELFKRKDVLEQVLGLAPHGSVQEYSIHRSAEPICAPESATHVEFVDKLGDAIEAFCRINQEDVRFYADSAAAREMMDALVSAWCTHPDNVALKALDHILVADGTNALPSQRLFQSWRLRDAVRMLIPGRWQKRMKISKLDPVWPEASLSRSGVLSRSVLRLSALLRNAKRALRSRLRQGQ